MIVNLMADSRKALGLKVGDTINVMFLAATGDEITEAEVVRIVSRRKRWKGHHNVHLRMLPVSGSRKGGQQP